MLRSGRTRIDRSRLRVVDGIADSLTAVARHPGRSLLSALGTVVGIAALVATIGLVQTARAQVSQAFNALAATQVAFQDDAVMPSHPAFGTTPQALAAERRADALPGVVGAGIVWPVDGTAPLAVETTPLPDPTGANATELPFTVADPGALAVMHATVSAGRLYDRGDVAHDQQVCLLGASAAAQLGITNLAASPAIFVGHAALTVVGIVSSAQTQTQALLGVIIPPGVAPEISSPGVPAEEMILQVHPGAAGVVGSEGALAISPTDPARLRALVPPSPQSLRAQISSSVSALLTLLGLVSLAVGVVSITTATLLSVLQRSSELGLRRALGARPRHIALLVLIESALVGTIGGVTGAALGVIATASTSATHHWSPVITPIVPLGAPVIGTLTGVLAGAYPAWRATRAAPAASMRRGG